LALHDALSPVAVALMKKAMQAGRLGNTKVNDTYRKTEKPIQEAITAFRAA